MFAVQAVTFSLTVWFRNFCLAICYIAPCQQCKSSNKTECTGTIVTRSSVVLVPVLAVQNAPVMLLESSEWMKQEHAPQTHLQGCINSESWLSVGEMRHRSMMIISTQNSAFALLVHFLWNPVTAQSTQHWWTHHLLPICWNAQLR